MDFMQVAAGGAAVLVAEMAKSSWEAVRAAMARLFGRGGAETAEQELRLLDAARERLVGTVDGERASVARTLEQQLLIQLAAFLQKNPEAAADLQTLADRSDETGEVRAQVSVHHNTGSQVLIAGGSVTAHDFSYGASQERK
ncbi:hypothetical protein [Streptomyces sp. NPDC059468]|uniref:hypothetical protein n=1 Tax=Streptomyces sp. NPDC059468 TaxID=3346845 RepID=UPI003678BED6